MDICYVVKDNAINYQLLAQMIKYQQLESIA